MSKELPYFRFTVSEWLNDDISIESYHLQGVFISVCAFYWFQDCSIAKAKLKKRFGDANEEIEELLNLRILKEDENGFIMIKFLDEQYDILSEKRRNRVEAGRKGGLARASKASNNAKAKAKQSSSYKDKDKDKDKDKEYTGEFEEFWELYGVKKGKKRAFQKWRRLTESEKEKIMRNVPVFLTHFSSEEYTPRPRKYLVNEYWNDQDYQQPKQQSNDTNKQKTKSRADRYFERNQEVIDRFPDSDPGYDPV